MSKDTRLALVLLANVGLVVALVVVGLLARSLGVLAAGGDYLGDAVGTGLILVALRMSRGAHRHRRAPAYATLANASFLLLVAVAVIVEALRRLIGTAPHVEGLPVIVVSIVAGAVMAACALIIGSVESDDLSMRSVMLDTLADGASAVGVAVSGTVILLAHGAYWLDSAVALGISAVIAVHAARLIRDVLADLRRRQRRRAAT
jgi:cobalt-zinc-cadmium efflux system protein